LKTGSPPSFSYLLSLQGIRTYSSSPPEPHLRWCQTTYSPTGWQDN
jgi:hypothetical protein